MEQIFQLSNRGDVAWILGTKPPSDEDDDLDDYEGEFTIPTEYELRRGEPFQEWRSAAIHKWDINRSAALIAIKLRNYHFVKSCAESYALALNDVKEIFQEAHLLYRPASPAEIANNLANVGDILNQKLPETTAMFIISLFMKAEMPPLIVSYICWHIASHEQGRLKPVTFQTLIERAHLRYSKMLSTLKIYNAAYLQFDEAFELVRQKEPDLFDFDSQAKF